MDVQAQIEQLAAQTKTDVAAKIGEVKQEFDTKSAAFASKEDVSALQAKADKVEALELALREQGTSLASLKAAGAGLETKTDLKTLVEKHMGDVEKVFNAKSGFTQLDIKAAAVMTQSNTIDQTTFSVPVNMIESMNMLDYVPKRYGRQFIDAIADITTVQAMDEYTTWLEEGSFEGAFAVVAEGALKPLVSTSLVRNWAKAQKIAGKYVVTEEFAKFRANAYNIIRRIIVDKLVRDYSALIVTGINSAAAAYTGTTMDDTVVVPNDYDAVGAVAAQIATLNFTPDTIILHPQDAWRIRLTKDDDNRYQFESVAQDGQRNIFGLNLFESTLQTLGYMTIGEAGLYKVENESITIRNGYGIDVTGSSPVTAVVSDFDNNRFRTIVEMFFKQWLPTPYAGSFVRAQFSTVKAALLKP